LITERLGWAPSVRLEDGMRRTYAWIFDQMTADSRRRVYV
jgi:nucleoside-diphosphate-sugar epimerase